MSYQVSVTATALEQLKHLPNAERDKAIGVIDGFYDDAHPMGAQEVPELGSGHFRINVDSMPIFYEVDEDDHSVLVLNVSGISGGKK